MANERLQHSDGMLLLQKKRALLLRWDVLAQQQLALSHLDGALPLLEEKEDCLEELQRVDLLLDNWDQSFPTELDEILEPQGLQRLLEKISRAEQEFARRVAQERNVTITEIKTLLQQLSYGAVKSNRPQPRRRKTIF